jgi:hypothetical protein
MLRKLSLGLVAIGLVAGGILQASEPAVTGNIQGVELAQQTDSHPAIFVGLFVGTVNGRIAIGAWAVAVEHDTPLPSAPEESIAITGGEWHLQLAVLQGFRLRPVSLGGVITGQLDYADVDLFAIAANMTVTAGGSGDILLNGQLDHTVFPPGVSGALTQP